MSTKESESPQDNVQPLNYREHFAGRETYTKHTDPCESAAKASMACMDRNSYDRDKCLDFFQAYRDCKKTWLDQRKADRRAGRDASL
ncbi:hypothetical protein SERLA73DRAFT_58401 [Serpula lacrymans var. lacrymans S7.3]|uniref:Cytochrome c oxidase-assembly factor COX23, mitochondrial n=2 Tax=Serpula lacrymans var. lacrymans TaxID=341189 RepID=F8Q4W7_SERL3|nr:uncharacterized protein SERLADRAFT_394928 [Serpula lacrymans var. lacrymans S7.9]EGN96594.1 hypothetical protein SERLA73DRAFT_58401 [Serpula lacrymans var. lacrymans S7.3]EGO22164.1 hypothetical protein SERLADRAFT_394928 [Serpula lacrymans var. lacrymans S7.9]